jgi:lysophospholipase L1-like esterase
MKRSRKLLLGLAVLVLLVVVAETALRVAGHFYLRRLYVHRAVRFTESPNSIRIVALGESSTAGLWVDRRRESYPGQLKDLLQKRYPGRKIHVIVPPHVGHNTSQVANRIDDYLQLYTPAVLVLMVGCNNEWSLAESHVSKFLRMNSAARIRVRLQILAAESRVYKVLHYAYLRFLLREKSGHVRALKNKKYIWGGPQLVRFPPEDWVRPFARSNRQAFVEMWRYDVDRILQAASNHSVPVILMTYHIQPAHLPVEEFVAMAHRHGALLLRNDEVFAQAVNARPREEYLLHDGWHPSPKGYELIARNVFRAIEENDLLRLNEPM